MDYKEKIKSRLYIGVIYIAVGNDDCWYGCG